MSTTARRREQRDRTLPRRPLVPVTGGRFSSVAAEPPNRRTAADDGRGCMRSGRRVYRGPDPASRLTAAAMSNRFRRRRLRIWRSREVLPRPSGKLRFAHHRRRFRSGRSAVAAVREPATRTRRTTNWSATRPCETKPRRRQEVDLSPAPASVPVPKSRHEQRPEDRCRSAHRTDRLRDRARFRAEGGPHARRRSGGSACRGRRCVLHADRRDGIAD